MGQEGSWSVPFFDGDGDNTAQVMKASGGYLSFLEVQNPNATNAYIQLFDALAANVTVGTTTPAMSLLVPAGGAMDKMWDRPLKFETAITYACTTTATGSGDPTTGLIVDGGYI